MRQDITAAKVGCVLKKWAKRQADAVDKGDLICTVTISSLTGTLDRDIFSKYSGTLLEQHFTEGDTVPGGAVLCVIDAEEEVLAESFYEAGEEIPVMLEASAGSGKVRKWYHQEHDHVSAGDLLLTVESGKLTIDVKSPCSGELVKIAVRANEDLKKGSAAAFILSDGTTPRPAQEKAKKTKVVVIGGGPGGYVAAIRAAQLGGDVTLIEQDRVGGTCLNVGCIPTKALLHSAELYHNLRRGEECGVLADGIRLDWTKVQAYREQTVSSLVEGVKGLLQANGVAVIKGHASLKDEKTVIAATGKSQEEVRADKIIIASGSRAFIPPVPGLTDTPGCMDSTGALEMESLPRSMTVIGGGVIGIELACAYAEFGTEVTVIEMLPRILPALDAELAGEGQKMMEEKGIRFVLGAQVLSAEKQEDGVRLHVRMNQGEERIFESEKVLVAVGRRSRTDEMELERVGIELDRGRIVTNDKLETNIPGIYAIGDCTGRLMLAHTAMTMGEAAAENAMGGKSRYSDKICPSCVYMMPELASVGMTEEQAKEKGIDYQVGSFPMAANGKSQIMQEPNGMVKILADSRTGKIMGVHILGARATDLIAEAAVAMKKHAVIGDLIDTIHPHPTVSEAVREAALGCEGRMIHYK